MPHTNIHSEWTKNVKQNIKAICVLEENLGKCFSNFGARIRKIMIKHPEAMKLKIDMYNCIQKFSKASWLNP